MTNDIIMRNFFDLILEDISKLKIKLLNQYELTNEEKAILNTIITCYCDDLINEKLWNIEAKELVENFNKFYRNQYLQIIYEIFYFYFWMLYLCWKDITAEHEWLNNEVLYKFFEEINNQCKDKFEMKINTSNIWPKTLNEILLCLFLKLTNIEIDCSSKSWYKSNTLEECRNLLPNNLKLKLVNLLNSFFFFTVTYKEEYTNFWIVNYLNTLTKTKEIIDYNKYKNTWTNELFHDKVEEMKYNLYWKKLVFFDTETTWVESDADIIEISYVIVSWDWINKNKITYKTWLFNTDKEIALWAKMTSWILKRHIIDKPYFKWSDMWKELKKFSEDENYIFVAHNLKFDKARLHYTWIDIDDNRWICTLKISRLLFPDLENHKLVWLKYIFEDILDASERLWLENKEHRAWYDTLMLYLTFNYLLNYTIKNQKCWIDNTTDIDYMQKVIKEYIRITQWEVLIRTLNWKYKWLSLVDIYDTDKQYLEWYYTQEKIKELTWQEFDESKLYSIENIFLKKRLNQ